MEVERPISPALFADLGTPDLNLSANPTEKDISAKIFELGEWMMLYRCALNAAGVTLANIEKLQACQGFPDSPPPPT